MRRHGAQGITLTDLVVTLAIMVLLVYLVRLDWRSAETSRGEHRPVAGQHTR